MRNGEQYLRKEFGTDPFDGKGQLLAEGPDYRLWACINPDGTTTFCNESFVEPILEANAERRAESDGKRWGDGQVVAAVPNCLLYGDGYYAKARQNRDSAAMKKFLNDRDNFKLRTKEGKL